MRRLLTWYHTATLRAKLALHVILSTASFFAILLPLVLYIQRHAILSEVEDNGFRLAQVFARSSVQAVVSDDYLIMQHVVNGISSERKVLYAILLKEDGEVLVHTKANERGKRYQDEKSLLAARTQAPLLQRYQASDGTHVYDFAIPVYVLDEKKASARIGLSIEHELAQIARTRNYIILLGLAILGLGLIWASYQAKRITQPVQELVKGTQEIAKGNLSHRISLTHGDELGQLAGAFNRMTESIQALIETSRELSSTLDPDEVLRSIAAHARELAKADVAFLAPLAKTATEAQVRVALGTRTDRLRNLLIRPGHGMGGQVLATGEPFETTNYLQDPRIIHDPVYDQIAQEEGIISALAVPITLKGDIVGLLWIANRSAKIFSQEDVDALQRMAQQAAIAMENARLYAESKLKTARLEAVIRVSQEITATLDLQRIAQVIVREISALMEGMSVRLWELREGEDTLRLMGASGLWAEALSMPVGQGLSGIVAATRSPVAVEDLRTDPRVLRRDLVKREGWISFLGIPFIREGKLLGVLSILTRAPHRFTQDEIDLFTSFAQQAAIAIENARLYQDLKQSHQKLLAAQEELVQKARMAAMGEIAAAVAHEARNPLGALSNSVQLLRKNPHITGEDAELLNIIQIEAHRLNEIVSDFLAFGRPRPPQFQVVDPHELIEESLALLQRDDRCSSLIAVSRRFDPSVPKIRADRDQLRQVFWNLFLNAVQAMGAEGELGVETRTLDAHVEILVRDTGPGIPATILPKIFEPFYSTKAGGTGLGLAIVRRIIREHGGEITVESHQPSGTRFALLLPVDQEVTRDA